MTVSEKLCVFFFQLVIQCIDIEILGESVVTVTLDFFFNELQPFIDKCFLLTLP